MTRMNRALSSRAARSARGALTVVGALLTGASCNENLPNGPSTFQAQLQITVPRDTFVVGDSSTAQAKAVDLQGRQIQLRGFTWTSADPTIVEIVTTGDAAGGLTQRMIGRRAGRADVTLSVADSRFVTSNATRTQTVVVSGVRVLSTHDTTLTAVNDTGVAIGTGLKHANGASVTQASLGLHWIHLGAHTTLVGQGDTIRYIAKSNGVDTLIASHDFCLAGAKCADTSIVRVSQQLTLSLSTHSLQSWSFADSLGPTVTLVDRRGNGLAGASACFVPATLADSGIVAVTPLIGTSDPATGVLAAPRLVSKGNGTAKVLVFGMTGSLVLAVDSVTEVVRQVARHVAVEPLRATISAIDSIPVRNVARDARGAVIADATITSVATNIALHGIWAGPTAISGASSSGTITPRSVASRCPE